MTAPISSAPPPPCFAWSPSPIPLTLHGGGKTPARILPREAGEGDRPHRALKDARLSTGYEDGGGGDRTKPIASETP